MGKGNGTTRTSTKENPRGLAGTGSVRSFLLSYTPKDDYFTSNEEIALITDKLKLSGMTADQLTDMRNQVVIIYRDAMDKEIKYDKDGNFSGRTEKYWEYSNGLNSVTAVIDQLRVRRGTPVWSL